MKPFSESTVPYGTGRAAGPDTIDRVVHRAEVNKANARHSTGPEPKPVNSAPRSMRCDMD
jgi:hypothetical protein